MDTVHRPGDVPVGELFGEVRRTAAVAEMLLITDHSRMKIGTADGHQSTEELQARLLPYAHPDDFFDAAE